MHICVAVVAYFLMQYLNMYVVGERVQNLRVPGKSGYQTNESGPVPGKLLILRAGNRVPN